MENNEMRNNTAEYLIRFYNAQAGTAFRAKNEWNQKAVLNAYDRAGQSSVAVKAHIRKWIAENGDLSTKSDAISRCFDALVGEGTEVKTEEKSAPVTEQQVQYSMGLLEKAVIDLISKAQAQQKEIPSKPQQYYKCVCEKCGHVMFVKAEDLWNAETGNEK